MESGVSLCHSCGESVGFASSGEIFIACHACNFPLCQSCLDFELKEGSKSCSRCGASYIHHSEDSVAADEKGVPKGRLTMASHLQEHQGTGRHGRYLSNISAAESESVSEPGNAIWKNRVESWKDKKKMKKKTATKTAKEAEIPSEQQMEEKQSAEAAEPLSRTHLGED